MKILQVIPYFLPAFQYGGPIPVVFDLSKEFVERGHDVTVATTTANGQHELDITSGKAIQLDGFDVYYFKRMKLERAFSFISYLGQSVGFFYSPEMRKYLKKTIKEFDIVHVHDIYCFPAIIAGSIAYKAQKPYIVHVHGMLDQYGLSRRKLKKTLYLKSIGNRLLNRAVAIIASNETERNNIAKLRSPTTITTIPNGTSFQANGRELDPGCRDDFDLGNKTVTLFLGRLHPVKGIDLLIRAFSKIASNNKNALLLIAGPDEIGYKTELMNLVNDLDCQEQIKFIGMIEGKRKEYLMRRANIFALSSYSEAFSVAVLDALSYGLPVAITRNCNFNDVERYNAGYVTPCDVDIIAHKLNILLNNPALRKEMGKNAINLIKEKYTWDIVADKTLALYNTVLEKK